MPPKKTVGTKAPAKKRAPRKRAPKKAAPAPKAIDPIAQAKAMLAQNKLAKEQACMAELQVILKRHRCTLSPRIIVCDGRQELGVDVLAQPE